MISGYLFEGQPVLIQSFVLAGNEHVLLGDDISRCMLKTL